MKTSILLVLAVLCLAAACPAQASPQADAVVAAVVKQARADAWPKNMPFVAIDLGGTRYLCRVDSGRRIHTTKSRRMGGGIVGTWAEMGVMPVDASMHDAAQGAGWLMSRSGGTWRRVATDEGIGYNPEALTKAGVPVSVIQKLGMHKAE